MIAPSRPTLSNFSSQEKHGNKTVQFENYSMGLRPPEYRSNLEVSVIIAKKHV